VPIAITAEQRALQAPIRDWAARAGTLALARSLEPGSTAPISGGPAGAPASPAGRAGAPAVVAHEKTPWAEHRGALATSLILLSVVAERALGLPTDEAR